MTLENQFRSLHASGDGSLDNYLDLNSGLPAIADPNLMVGEMSASTPAVGPAPAFAATTALAVTPPVAKALAIPASSFATVVASELVGTGNFQINLTFDAAAQTAGVAFETSIAQAATLLTQAISSKIAVTINVQIGANEGGITPGSGGAQAGPSFGSDFGYQQVVGLLKTNAATGDTNFNALSTGPSIQGQSLVTVWNAQQKMLGLLAGNATGLDATAQFDSLIPSTELTGVALHEIAHALGRVPNGPTPDIFDLFRFTSVGTVSLDNGTPPAQQAYFSVNGGVTTLAAYGNLSDPSDFLNNYPFSGDPASPLTPNDPFNQAYDSNTVQTLTAVDLTQLDVLGFSTTAACFAAGTMIATRYGETPIEHLRPGDEARTFEGLYRPIVWIGFRSVDLIRHTARDEVEPIRISAGALAEGVPLRDLRVSPEHAMYLNGGLVPARLLVNGASIVRETGTRHVTWYHVELETHDLLLAEGAASESYLDTGNRAAFENAPGPTMLHPRFEGGQQDRVDRSCAPFIDDPTSVEPIWRGLADRARAIGHMLPTASAVTGEPAIMVRIGTRLFAPLLEKHGRYVFALPAAREPVRLISRAAAANWHRPWLADRRVLGVAVGGIEVQRASDVDAMPADHPDLRDGWWDVEHDPSGIWRWTDGDATLPITLDRPAVLSVLVRDVGVYPADAIAA